MFIINSKKRLVASKLPPTQYCLKYHNLIYTIYLGLAEHILRSDWEPNRDLMQIRVMHMDTGGREAIRIHMQISHEPSGGTLSLLDSYVPLVNRKTQFLFFLSKNFWTILIKKEFRVASRSSQLYK